ncbi:hypothetical protein BGZ98_003292 [Dissophora globulifera]|nr:hypothetical protein BGZ98_003292 [Dissophora globulifera]
MNYHAAFLPPLVRELVCFDKDHAQPQLSTALHQPPTRFLDSRGLLSIEAIQHCCLPQPPVNNGGAAATAAQVESYDLELFKRACTAVLSELQGLTDDGSVTLTSLYSEQLDWLGVPSKRVSEIWFELYELGDHNQAWLVGSTVLEQLLGNLQVLAMMIGDPLTLNIRNLLWHGFIIPGDDIPLDAYGAMLVTVTMTIAHSAKARLATTPLVIRHLNPKDFYYCGYRQQPVAEDDFDAVYERVAYGPPPAAFEMPDLLRVLDALITQSKFVTPGTADQWRAACQHLQPDSQSSFVFVMSSLPLIEHALRLQYVAVNGCKEDRRSALIAGEYYLILDVMLDKVVPAEHYDSDSPVLKAYNPNEIPNKLIAELGAQTVNLLNDLFLLVAGARLRDRASHGEINVFLTRDVTVAPWFNYYIGVVIYLLGKDGDIHESQLLSDIERYTSWISNYNGCRFEEWSVLRREVARCQFLLAKYSSQMATIETTASAAVAATDHDSDPSDGLAESKSATLSILLKFQDAPVFSSQESFSKTPIEDLLRKSLALWLAGEKRPAEDGARSLSMANNLSAWTTIIQSIHSSIQRAMEKITTLSEQLMQRQLSSRNRKRFEEMKPQIPRLLGMLVGCLALVEHYVLTPSTKAAEPLPANLTTEAVAAVAATAGFLSAEDTIRQGGPLAASDTLTALATEDMSNSAFSSSPSSSSSIASRSSTPNAGSGTAAAAVDKSGVNEIILRLKITTFVDKFASNFDRAKWDMIGAAWEDLVDAVKALETGGQAQPKTGREARYIRQALENVEG